jgi:hypothetical protein
VRPDLDLDPDGLDAAAAHASALEGDLEDLARDLQRHPAADGIGRVVAEAAHEVATAAHTFRQVAAAARQADAAVARGLGDR